MRAALWNGTQIHLILCLVMAPIAAEIIIILLDDK